MFGGYGKFGSTEVYKTYTWANAHYQVEGRMSILKIDSWNSWSLSADYLYIYFDGVEQERIWNTNEEGPKNQCGLATNSRDETL